MPLDDSGERRVERIKCVPPPRLFCITAPTRGAKEEEVEEGKKAQTDK